MYYKCNRFSSQYGHVFNVYTTSITLGRRRIERQNYVVCVPGRFDSVQVLHTGLR